MKNQYFGDVNDYRKYGLLRLLSIPQRIKLGICWMLTPDDSGPHGNKTSYLDKANEAHWRQFDPDLYDFLRRKVKGHEIEPKSRNVKHIDTSVISHTVFWNDVITDNGFSRKMYFEEMWKSFQAAGTDLIFFDPDNGLASIAGQSPLKKGSKNSCKFLFRDEIHASVTKGFSVLFYQHFTRTSRAALVEALECELAELNPCNRAYSFWTPHVLFMLIPNEKHLECIQKAVTNIRISPWTAAGSCRTSRMNDCRQILVREYCTTN